MSRDYSQHGDPYGINREYTAQSADQDVRHAARREHSDSVDARGNPSLPPRGMPTQAECDVIKGEM
jgi:hypothetical protein